MKGFISTSGEDPIGKWTSEDQRFQWDWRAWQPIPVFLPGESPRTEEPGELQSMGSKESDMAEQLSTAQHREERGQNMCIPSTETEFSCSELSTKVLSFSVSFPFPSP